MKNALDKIAEAVATLNKVVVIRKSVSNPVQVKLLKDLRNVDLSKVDLSGDDALCEKLGEEVFLGLMQQPKKETYIGRNGRGRMTLADIGRVLLTV